MSYCRLVNCGSWAPSGSANPPTALKMNPVKELHLKYYDRVHHRRFEIDYSLARFKISTLIEALHYVVDFSNRPAACKCMSNEALTPEIIEEGAIFLRGFA